MQDTVKKLSSGRAVSMSDADTGLIVGSVIFDIGFLVAGIFMLSVARGRMKSAAAWDSAPNPQERNADLK